jgi:hypothetical protein
MNDLSSRIFSNYKNEEIREIIRHEKQISSTRAGLYVGIIIGVALAFNARDEIGTWLILILIFAASFYCDRQIDQYRAKISEIDRRVSERVREIE